MGEIYSRRILGAEAMLYIYIIIDLQNRVFDEYFLSVRFLIVSLAL